MEKSMRTEVKVAIIAGLFVLSAAIIYSTVPSLIESHKSSPKIEILDINCIMKPPEKMPLKIINSSTNEVIASYEVAYLPCLYFTIKNKGNEVASINKITVTILDEPIFGTPGGGPICPSANFTLELTNYTLELDEKHTYINLGTSYSIPTRFRVEPHDVDCFTLTIDDSESSAWWFHHYNVTITLYYDHKKVETGPMSIRITKPTHVKYLFSVEAPELEDDLKRGVISEGLKKICEDESFPLSENATIRRVRDKWLITNYGERINIIKGEDGRLYFYRRG